MKTPEHRTGELNLSAEGNPAPETELSIPVEAEATIGPDGGDCDHEECIAFRAAARKVAEVKIDQYLADKSMNDFARMLGMPTTRDVLSLSRPNTYPDLPDNYLAFELAPAADNGWLSDDQPVARIDVQVSGYLLTKAQLIELHTKLGAELGL